LPPIGLLGSVRWDDFRLYAGLFRLV